MTPGSPVSRPRWTARFRSLQGRIGLALGALIILGALVLAFALAAYARTAFVALAAANVEALGQQMARELSSGMDRFAREIQLQAANPVMDDPAATTAELRRALEAIQRVYPEFSYISVVDAESGRVLSATGGIFEGGDANGRPVFEQGRKGLFVGDVHDAVRLAALLPRPSSGEPLRFLDVAAPIVDGNGKLYRVVASHLSWEWSRHIKDRILSPVEASRKVQMLLVDTLGMVVLAPDASVPVGTRLRSLGSSAARGHPVRWSDGVDYLTAEVPTAASGAFQGLGWRVVVRQPMDVVLATANQLRNLFLLGALLLGGIAAAIAWVVAGRIIKPLTDLARAADGLVIGENLASTFDPDDTGLSEVVAVRHAFRRVTGEALERAERLLQQLDSVYRGAPVGLCVVDARLRYLRINQVWADAFGLDPEDSLGTPLAQLPHDMAFAAALRRTLAADPAPLESLEVETAGPGGPRIWQTGLAPLGDGAGAVVGVSIVATDITALKLAEQALRLADARKNNFVAMLAHELRNPLAPIVNALHVLERGPPAPQAARMRDMILAQVQHMVRLIDDLLDVSRVSHNKVALRFERVTVGEVCAAAADTVRPLFDGKAQRFEMEIDDALPPIRADRIRMTQVIGNLLNNASKYAPQAGLIRLRAIAHQTGIRVTVQDNGRGIGPALLPHVFELFTQGDVSLDRSEGGLGIGLSIVKSLVDMHGGKVTAHSDGPGQGSCFTVELPVDAAAVDGAAPPPRPGVSGVAGAAGDAGHDATVGTG